MGQFDKQPLWIGPEIAQVMNREWIRGASESWEATVVCYYPTQAQ